MQKVPEPRIGKARNEGNAETPLRIGHCTHLRRIRM